MIKRIQIDNFKSFGKLDIEPHPRVNLLIGPNSSGNSNFLEALRLGNALKGNPNKLEEIWESLNGKSNRLCRPGANEFYIELDFDFKGRILGLFDSVKLSRIHQSASIQLKHSDKASAHFDWEKYKMSTSHFSNLISREECEEFFKQFSQRGVVLFRPDLLQVRKPVTLRKFDYLSENLSEVALLIKHLGDEHADSNNIRFREDLFKITQEFKLVTTPSSSVDGQIELKFFTEDGSFDSNEVSDGILYFTAILAILHQPNPPKVILLEEPENGIHPRRIIEIYRLITKLAEEKNVQFFITTHSPILLNQFSEDPECVWVFDKEDGISNVQNLHHDILEPRRKKLIEIGVEDPADLTNDLGENWLLGLIDGVPPSILPDDF